VAEGSTMKIKEKLKISLVFIIIFLTYAYLIMPSALSWGPINNYRNISVRTTVNITDAIPEILDITCNSGTPITLIPGTVQPVTCHIQLRDYNGGSTLNGTVDSGTGVSGVNVSTFYHILNLSSDPDDNNVHYTNSSCATAGPASGYYINWTCGFYLWYYANNGTWTANVTVYDRYNNRSYNVSGYSNATIEPLYALNVTDIIDFGNMFQGETSQTPVEANITNFGNMNINVSLYGYGGENQSLYSSLAMICQIGNLSLSTERWSLNSSLAWSNMAQITGTDTLIQNFTLPQRIDDSAPTFNATYWRLYVDPVNTPFGQCNGTVVFSSIALD
jgi:hypothetical protein